MQKLLFRTEEISKHRNRLSGDVAIAVPVAWQTIAFTIFGSASLGLLFLSLASYSRVEALVGKNHARCRDFRNFPTRTGVTEPLAMKDAQMVPARAEPLPYAPRKMAQPCNILLPRSCTRQPPHSRPVSG